MKLSARTPAALGRSRQALPLALLAASSLSALLVACGGGGGTSADSGSSTGDSATAAPTAKATAAALYFTDDFSAGYDAVWVTLSRVSVVNAAGVETEIASYSPGRRLNLSTLRQAGTLAASAQIPVDAVSVRVYADSAAQLQRLDGSLLDVSLSLSGGYLSFKLEGWDRASGVLALDFDLPRFSLQGSTLVAATRLAGTSDYAAWNHRDAEIKGTVSAVSASSLTLDTGAGGSQVFVLDANTSFVSVLQPGWSPAVGDRVEVYSSVSGQGTALQYTARVVKQRPAAGSAASSVEVKGRVLALSGSVVTLAISASGSGGPTGQVDIDLAGASFKRGSLAAVVAGVRLEVYLKPGSGTASGSGWVALAVELEGAAKSGSGARADYAELKGKVISLSGSLLTLSPSHKERFAGSLPAGDLTVDLAQASFEKSALSCLSASTPVELKGYVDASGRFQVTRVEAEGACAAAVPASGVPAATGSASAPAAGEVVELKGTISAVRSGEFELSLYSQDGRAPSLSSVTVRYDSTSTAFKGLSASTLQPGRFLEVKGTLQGSVLSALKIERE